jgi:hypothetical protein
MSNTNPNKNRRCTHAPDNGKQLLPLIRRRQTKQKHNAICVGHYLFVRKQQFSFPVSVPAFSFVIDAWVHFVCLSHPPDDGKQLLPLIRRRQTKQKHNAICVGHQYTQTNTSKVNKTWFANTTIPAKHVTNKRTTTPNMFNSTALW